MPHQRALRFVVACLGTVHLFALVTAVMDAAQYPRPMLLRSSFLAIHLGFGVAMLAAWSWLRWRGERARRTVFWIWALVVVDVVVVVETAIHWRLRAG